MAAVAPFAWAPSPNSSTEPINYEHTQQHSQPRLRTFYFDIKAPHCSIQVSQRVLREVVRVRGLVVWVVVWGGR